MKPLIGITMCPDEKDGNRFGRLYSFYMDAVRAASGVPVMLFDGEDEADTLAKKLDGLLLSGGDDVDPSLYGEANLHSKLIDHPRDSSEWALLSSFCEAHKPVLGICRGIQVMAAALGGSLWQDILQQTGIDHKFGCNHSIIVRQGSFLSPILPEQAEVNSTHHQAVRTLPPRFMTSAVSQDGIIEAMEATDGRLLYAVQFHPERMLRKNEQIAKLFLVLTETK
jgi:putative glutamine amidotransferase